MATVTYYFDSYDAGETWANNPANMADGNTANYASTNSDGDVNALDGNTCPGTHLGTITKIEIRAYGYRQLTFRQGDIKLRPVFSGGDGDNHVYTPGGAGAWSSWYDITSDTSAPGSWGWSDVDHLDCDVEFDRAKVNAGGCSKVEIRVTYSETGTNAEVLAVLAAGTADALTATVTTTATVEVLGVASEAVAAADGPSIQTVANSAVTAQTATSQADADAPTVVTTTTADIQTALAEAVAAADSPSIQTVVNSAVAAQSATSQAEAFTPMVMAGGIVSIEAEAAEAVAEAIAPIVTVDVGASVLAVVAEATAEAIAPIVYQVPLSIEAAAVQTGRLSAAVSDGAIGAATEAGEFDIASDSGRLGAQVQTGRLRIT